MEVPQNLTSRDATNVAVVDVDATDVDVDDEGAPADDDGAPADNAAAAADDGATDVGVDDDVAASDDGATDVDDGRRHRVQSWKAATDSLLSQLLTAGGKKGPAKIRWLTRCNSESLWKCACFDFVSKGVPCKHVIAAAEHDADNESAPSIILSTRRRFRRSC